MNSSASTGQFLCTHLNGCVLNFFFSLNLDTHLCTLCSSLPDSVPGDHKGNTGTEGRYVSELLDLTCCLFQHRPIRVAASSIQLVVHAWPGEGWGGGGSNEDRKCARTSFHCKTNENMSWHHL